MKNSSLIFIVLLLIISLGTFGFNSLSWAQQTSAAAPAKGLQKFKFQKGIPKAKIETDLRVGGISANQCPCSNELSAVDAILMDKIIVSVANWPCKDGRWCTAKGKIKVTYYDLTKGRLETITKPFPLIKAYPATFFFTLITIVDRYVLLRKSTGIKAEVIPDPPYKDCDLSNNIMTFNKCHK